METGEIIRKLRKERGWSQELLGTYLGVQKSAVAKWENGRVNNLKKETIDALAVLFGVQPAYIRGEIGETLMLNADEIELMNAYRKAPVQTQKIIRMMLSLKESV